MDSKKKNSSIQVFKYLILKFERVLFQLLKNNIMYVLKDDFIKILIMD